MRPGRKPESARLTDRYAGLRANYERIEAEAQDLEPQVVELEQKAALARHLGRGNLEKIEAKLHASGIRQVDLCAELDGLRRALAVLANEIATAERVEALDRVIATKDEREKTAREVETLMAKLDRARARDEQAVAAVEAAEGEVSDVEAMASAIATAIEDREPDPLAAATRARDARKQVERRREGEVVSWGVREILTGSQKSLVLERIPAGLRPEVERQVAEARSPAARERDLQCQIENTKAKGEGLIINGEHVVQPEHPTIVR
jgi:hypothetical protein